MKKSYLVEILVPKEKGGGEPVGGPWFEAFPERADREVRRGDEFLARAG
jgi:hypothetical protein